MTDHKTVAVRTVDETLNQMGQEFVEAWRHAEAGLRIGDRERVYVPIETLAALATAKRIELLRHLHATPERNISDLAKHLKRDYRRVHDDVSLLLDTGLVLKEEGMLRAPYKTIEVSID